VTASGDVDGHGAARHESRRAGATVVDQDPVDAARRLAELDGLSALRAIMAGDIPPPPFGVLLGFEPVEVEEGRVVFAVEPDDRHYNPIGSVHGGLAATLIDSATGCAVHSTLPAGVAYTTTDLQVRYVRGITRDTGRILCEGTVVHRGRTIATAQARVTAGDRLLAHGTAGVLILPPDARTASTAPPASASG
jgi:uncharacterized protein (TIGR00369 family)